MFFKKRVFLVTLQLVLLSSLSGCIVLPAIEGFSKLGLSKADREKLLPKVVKDFHDSLYWNDPMSAAGLVKADKRNETIEGLRKQIEGVRVVESKIQSVQFDEDSEKAEVRINVKSYKVPFYIVEDHILIEQWEFSLHDGWQYVSQKEASR